MKVIITKIKLNAINHRTLMVGTAVPSWWEILFLFRWFKKPLAFVGKGATWYHHPNLKPVKKFVAKQLEMREHYFKIYGK